MNYHELGAIPVAGAAAFVLVAGIISFRLKLGLERQLALGVIRSSVQLLAVGYALTWVFAQESLAFTALAMLVMVGAAARAALARAGWRVDGGYLGAFVSLVATAGVMAIVGSALLVRADPWYQPAILLPLLGMLLGNGLNGVSLALDSLLGSLVDDAPAIEADLALGATRWEAARAPVARAVRRGIIPIVNAMMVVGIVSLPGMMTGQILGGVPPVQAVRYQLLILFLIAAATSLGSLGVATFAVRRLIDQDHRLRPDRVTSRK